ncbi:MAG: polyhydroxybutyrate depolymerase [Acidimicrobiales bacterium]|nr:polyhydroxybutyrate depolymerase [Acidimicrobiales bacterium]
MWSSHRRLAALAAVVAVGMVAVLAISTGTDVGLLRLLDEPDPGGTSELTIDVDGTPRHVVVHGPPGAGAELPLVINLHGAGSTGAAIQADSGLDAFADRLGFVTAYPNGLHETWNAGGCCLRAVAEQVPDVELVRRLVDELVEHGQVDPRRVYVAGFSNGGMLAARVACEVPGIAGVGIIAGALVSPCTSTSVDSVLLVHGSIDPMVPPAGYDGLLTTGQRLHYPPLANSATTWRRLLGCAEASDERRTGGILVRRWSGCERGYQVELTELLGMGHGWPGNRITATPDDQGFDATAALVRAFGLDRNRSE